MGLGQFELSLLEASAMTRVVRLPLIQSALQNLSSAYSQVKGRHPLLQIMGGVAELGMVSVSQVALKQATPLLQSLEPQIDAANSLVLLGLDRLEQNFPVLHQSTEEVASHLRDALLLTLDDLQLMAVDGLDAALERVEQVAEVGWSAFRQLQESAVGQAAAHGLDEVLTRLEEVTALYLPLPPTLRLQWEQKVRQFEEDDEDEPSAWTRVRSLVLILVLQIYHRLLKTRDQLQRGLTQVQNQVQSRAEDLGLAPLLDLVGNLLQSLQNLLVALLYQAQGLRNAALVQIQVRSQVLIQWAPVQRAIDLPEQIQNLVRDLQELSKLLLQLIINATPLYNMIQQPSEQEVEEFLNQHDFTTNSSSRRSSANANSLFLKAMDGRPRRRRSLYSLAARGASSPEPIRRQSQEDASPLAPEGPAPRRPSATDLLLAPLRQFVSQSQRAFEYLSTNEGGPQEGEEGEEGEE